MSKKHFEAAAKVVKAFAVKHNLTTEAHVELAKELATFCERFNDKFDRARFLKACGVDDVVSSSPFWKNT